MKIQYSSIIAMYLNSNIDVARFNSNNEYKRKEYSLNSTNYDEVCRYKNLKPVLKPISCLFQNQEILHKIRDFANDDMIFWGLENKKRSQFYDGFVNEYNQELTHNVLIELFRLGIDIYELIDMDLAIDANSIT